MQVDDTDRRLLRHLQVSPELTNAELADRAGVSPVTCWRRLEKLQSAGILLGRHAVINWPALGYEVEVSLRITLDKTQSRAFDEFMDAARDVPEVIEIQTFLGRVDVRLSVLARDMQHYQHIYRTRILTLPHIADIEALMQVANIKETDGVPL
ncbi:Lrp/AsnC family transcriptional regulator [Aliiroseovarius sp. YM-037]|uniref:Lrp/AsnC family transcriptional regulator n=1 Tax=Aliiroseovarius sp. YM-037 TaxID=3341728 RepID=UPI003A7FCF8B